MPGLSPEQSEQLQALINANRAPSAGTWASPNTAPLAAPAVAAPISPAVDPAALAAAAPQGVPVGVADAPVTAPIVAASPGDAASVVAPVSVPAPPVAAEPSVSAPAASTAGLDPTAPVEAAPLPAAPRNFEEAQARSTQATHDYSQAVRDEGDARSRAEAANATTYEAQAKELEQNEAEAKRDQAEGAADRDEARAQISLLQERNTRLNKITDRRTTTQKVLGVLAQALGSVADGFSRMGGNTNTNYAGEISKQLDTQIQRNIDRQQEAIDGRNKELAMKLTELGQADATLKDKQSARLFLTSQKQNRFAVELKAQAARSGSELAKKEMLTAAAKLEADAARNDAILQERLTEQKYRSRQLGKSGSGGGGGALDLATIRATVENGGTLTPAQFKAAKDMGLFKADGKTIAEIENTAEGDRTPEEQTKLNKAKGQGGQTEGDLIAGYETIPGSQPLDKGNYGKARDIAGGVEGVRTAGNKMADLFQDVMDAEERGDKNAAEAARSRYYTAGGQFLVQKSLAGGQGVINQSDAERDAQEGAVPPPPGAPSSALSRFQQAYKGVSASPNGIRAITDDVAGNGVSRLKAYNLQPRGAAPADRKPAPQNPMQTKDAATGMPKFIDPPAGKVWVVNTETGVKGAIPADRLKAYLQSGKYAQMVN